MFFVFLGGGFLAGRTEGPKDPWTRTGVAHRRVVGAGSARRGEVIRPSQSEPAGARRRVVGSGSQLGGVALPT